MPYKDSDQARKYNTDYQRARRAGMPGKAAGNLPSSVRIRSAADILALLEDTINSVCTAEADPLVKARVIVSLASVTLKSVEVANLEARLLDVEEMLKKGGKGS